jgi:hypothetical protein
LLAQLAAWDKTVAKERRKRCSKVLDSQRKHLHSAQASGKTAYRRLQVAYDHYFGKGKGLKLNPQPADVMRTAYRLAVVFNQSNSLGQGLALQMKRIPMDEQIHVTFILGSLDWSKGGA